MFDQDKCPICNDSNLKFCFKNYDKMFQIEKMYNIYKCTKCGLIITKLPKSIKYINQLYPSNYYSTNSKEPTKTIINLYKFFYSHKSPLIKFIFKPLQNFFQINEHFESKKRILDIGCGSGDFLTLAKMFDMQCYGIEPTNINKALQKKYKLSIKKGVIEKAKYPNEFFDLITINHVIEHLTSPKTTLNKIHKILKKDGKVVINTPNTSSLAFNLFNSNWVQLDTPRHINIFCPKTFEILAKNTNFKIISISYTSTSFQISGSFLYLTNKLLNKKIRLLDKHIFNNKIFWFGLMLPSIFLNMFHMGDQIEIVLKKIVN